MNRYKMLIRSFQDVSFRTSALVSMGLVCALVPSVRTPATQGYAAKRSVIGRQVAPVVILQTSDNPIDTGGPTSALVSSPNGDDMVYIVNGMTGEVGAYQGGPEPSYRSFADTVGPFAVRSRDSIAYIDRNSKVVLAEPKGRILRKIDTPPAISLATLSNGNVVVASPTEKHFLHLYSPTGQVLRSFGRLKKHGQVDDAEVQFLHKGKLLVDAADNIYYVYHYLPLVQKFSSDGVLKLEIDVQGDAVSLQQELAQRFFSNRKPNTIGGITIINSGAIDWRTGHMWLGLNGSSISGIVYEYDKSGEKLTEYALVAGASAVPQVILGAMDLVVTPSKLYVLTSASQGSHVFSFVRRGSNSGARTIYLDRRMQKGGYAIKPVALRRSAAAAVQTCGTPQAWPECPYTCPQPACVGTNPTAMSSDGSQKDCKAALIATLATGFVVVTAPCLQYAPGTAMHMRGGCRDEVTICRDGSTSTHHITLDCPAPTCPTEEEGGGGGVGCNQNGELCGSPILIDIQGNGFDLTDASNGVSFDLKPGGTVEHTAWTSPASDDAFLVLDRNGNGTIDDGSELFGDSTRQPPSAAPNGFLALAEFDKPDNGGNGDGKIDRNDPVFSSLRLWQDRNHNGISEPDEIRRLRAPGLAAIDLDYRESRRVDQYGNWFRYRARVRDAQGAHLGRWAWDVFFVIE